MGVLSLGKDPDPAFENEGKDLRIRIKKCFGSGKLLLHWWGGGVVLADELGEI
jgi:hypothetical protein